MRLASRPPLLSEAVSSGPPATTAGPRHDRPSRGVDRRGSPPRLECCSGWCACRRLGLYIYPSLASTCHRKPRARPSAAQSACPSRTEASSATRRLPLRGQWLAWLVNRGPQQPWCQSRDPTLHTLCTLEVPCALSCGVSSVSIHIPDISYCCRPSHTAVGVAHPHGHMEDASVVT